MSESVPCYTFPCKMPNCPMPIMLPIDAFKRLFPHQGMSANDDLSVILVCDACKHANIYSPDRRSQYYHSRTDQVSLVHSGETKIELWLRCAGSETEFQVPLVVTWTKSRLEEEKPAICASWIAHDMRCPNGHAIYWPWRQSE